MYFAEEGYFPYDAVLSNLLCFVHNLHVVLAQYELLSPVFPVILGFLYSFLVPSNLAPEYHPVS